MPGPCWQLGRTDKESVFSRAIDVTPDWRAALDVLMELGVTRALTSGQAASAPAGAATIRAMREYAAGRIQILPGCGVNPDNAAAQLEQTGFYKIHGTFKSWSLD